MSSQNEAIGMDRAASADSEFGAISFILTQMLSKLNTMTLVKVVACTNNGGLSPVGFVDVQPMVHQMSGDRKATAHAVIYNIPYFRLQGGANAVIIDPEVGDIGMCGFCSRDISSVKKNKGPSTPASYRTHDWSDGLYFGGHLNGAPIQYVQMNAKGIKIFSPTKITIESQEIEFIGKVSQSGGAMTVASTLSAGEDVSAAGKSLKSHTHHENDVHGETGAAT
jgi:hypothetical protein